MTAIMADFEKLSYSGEAFCIKLIIRYHEISLKKFNDISNWI